MAASQHHLSELLQEADPHSSVGIGRERSDEIAAAVAAVARETVQEALVGGRPSPEVDLRERAEILAYNVEIHPDRIEHLIDRYILPALLSAYADGLAATRSK